MPPPAQRPARRAPRPPPRPPPLLRLPGGLDLGPLGLAATAAGLAAIIATYSLVFEQHRHETAAAARLLLRGAS